MSDRFKMPNLKLESTPVTYANYRAQAYPKTAFTGFIPSLTTSSTSTSGTSVPSNPVQSAKQEDNYTIQAPTSGAYAYNPVVAATTAGANVLSTVNNIKSIKKGFEDGKYNKKGDSGNEAAWRAGAAMGATALGAGMSTAASFIDPGAQNAKDVQTLGMVNAGLDTAAQFGVYGQLASGAGKLAIAMGNRYAKKQGENVAVNTELMAKQEDAYKQTFADVNKAANPGLKALFHRNKVAEEQAQAIYKQQLIGKIEDRNQDVQDAATYEGTGINNQMVLNGGPRSLRAGKQGMKMQNIVNLFNSHNWAKGVVKAAKGVRLNTFKAVEPETQIQQKNSQEEVPFVLKQPMTFSEDDVLKSDLNTLQSLIDEGSASKTTFGSYTLLTVDDDDIYDYIVNNPKLMGYLQRENPGLSIAKTNNDPVEINVAPTENTENGSLEQLLINPQEDELTQELPTQEIPNNFNLQTLQEAVQSGDINYNPQLFYNISESLRPFVYENDLGGFSFDSKEFVNQLNNSETPFSKLLSQYLTNEAANQNTTTTQIATGLFNILNNLQPTKVGMYKEGGSFNVIPAGALHKNKHNMENAEGLTKKGIPVITEENGEKVQQAEIEANEIIFRLEITEKLESLAKEGTDEAAIEAGKLLVKEILHNTKDNTGLIKEV